MIRTIFFFLLSTAIVLGEHTSFKQCLLSQQIIPGPSQIVRTDSNGKTCKGTIKLPVCTGFCKTSESGTHTFPHRVENSSACVLVQTGVKEIPLSDCDEGADNSIRMIKIPDGTQCACKKFPLD
ncbi:unnamed protein product [Auanema sp. JU1783]|nr:unnamed protein product [Auanema sp. JU1783]